MMPLPGCTSHKIHWLYDWPSPDFSIKDGTKCQRQGLAFDLGCLSGKVVCWLNVKLPKALLETAQKIGDAEILALAIWSHDTGHEGA